MQKWNRWQDWTALVLGAYAVLAPIWTNTDTKTTWTMIVLGAVTAVVSLWSLAAPGDQASEYVHALIGVAFFIAPWAMAFTALTGMAWTAWLIGLATFVIGISAIPVANRAHTAITAH